MMTAIEGHNEEQIAVVVKMLRESKYIVICSIDADQRLAVVRKGIPEISLAEALRYYADVVDKMQREEAHSRAEEAFNAAPEHMRCICPACDAPVILMSALPSAEMLERPNVKARCVCTCGAFLVPFYIGEALGMRLMTMEEIADLPDELRNHMLGLRKEFARDANKAN